MKNGKLQSDFLALSLSDTSSNKMRVLLLRAVLGIGFPVVGVLNAVPDSTSGDKRFCRKFLSQTITKITEFWCFTQKFKMATKTGRKLTFAKK